MNIPKLGSLVVEARRRRRRRSRAVTNSAYPQVFLRVGGYCWRSWRDEKCTFVLVLSWPVSNCK